MLGEDAGDGWNALIVFNGERLNRFTGDAVNDVEGTG